jgi:hypothetical protein
MVMYVENSGESLEEAIIILEAESHREGVASEYEYLERRFGKRGKDWELERQSLLEKGDKYYDRMDLIFPDGTKKIIYFDITSFFMETMALFKELLEKE